MQSVDDARTAMPVNLTSSRNVGKKSTDHPGRLGRFFTLDIFTATPVRVPATDTGVAVEKKLARPIYENVSFGVVTSSSPHDKMRRSQCEGPASAAVS